jgi:hypothetical protein
MANLNENYHLLSYIEERNKNRTRDEADKIIKNGKWYDRVYLCHDDDDINQYTYIERTDFQKHNPYLPILGFYCYRFDLFTRAEYAWNNYLFELHSDKIKYTMFLILPLIIGIKLKKQLLLSNHFATIKSKRVCTTPHQRMVLFILT